MVGRETLTNRPLKALFRDELSRLPTQGSHLSPQGFVLEFPGGRLAPRCVSEVVWWEGLAPGPCDLQGAWAGPGEGAGLAQGPLPHLRCPLTTGEERAWPWPFGGPGLVAGAALAHGGASVWAMFWLLCPVALLLCLGCG